MEMLACCEIAPHMTIGCIVTDLLFAFDVAVHFE